MKTCGIDISSYNSDIDLDGYNTLINEDTGKSLKLVKKLFSVHTLWLLLFVNE